MHNKHNNIDELFKSELTGLDTPAPVFVKKQIDKSLFKKNIFFFLLFIPLFTLIGVFIFSNTEVNSDNILKNNIEQREEKKFNLPIKTESESNFKEQLKTSPPNLPTLNDLKIVSHHPNLSQSNNTTAPETQFRKTKFVKPLNSKINTDLANSTSTDLLATPAPKTKRESNISNKKDLIQKNNFKISKADNENKIVDLNPNLLVQSNINETQIKPDEFRQDNTLNKVTIQPINQTENLSIDTKTKVKPEITSPPSITQIETAKIHPIIRSEDHSTDTKNEVKPDTASLLHIAEIPIKKEFKINDTIEKQKITGTPLTHSRTFSYLISWTSGVNLSKSTYSSKDDNEAHYYQSNHTDNINFEHNISLNTLLRNNIIIGSGIGTSIQSYDYRYNEESTYTFTTLDSSIVFSNYVYASTDTLQQFAPIDSNYLIITDTISGTSTSNTSFSGTSQVQYIHIPLQIGYMYQKNKLMVAIQLNARYNIRYKASGRSFTNNTVNSIDKTNSIFKKSYFDFAVKADVYYNIFDKFFVNTSIKYTPKLNNTYQNLPLERTVKHFHFGLGLSYKF